ncbi:MAG: amino acid ABC transporter permease [Opitutae bacterium]|jgi:polar amino acid transport system permease protein|nr:amino acid ABC transporter permease [Opitutae bacterium]
MDYHFNFSYIWRHFDRLLYGLALSLELALVSIGIGMIIGLLLALVYVESGKTIRFFVASYVELIRNSPLLLLVYLIFYGIPSIGWFQYSATTSFIVTLSIYSGAYLVEVFRSGLASVPEGLIDAGKAIGMKPWQRLISIRIPTMFRIILPALSNTYISLFKDTSIASVIAVPELMYGAQWINFNTFRIIEVYAVITPMYLVTGYLILLSLRQVEKKFAI